MAYEELAALEAIGGGVDLAGSVLARAQAQEAVDDAAEERRTAERSAEFQRRGEVLALANRQLGDPLGEIRRAQQDVMSLADQEAELLTKLAKVRGRLESARSAVGFWSDRLLIVEEQSARSRVPDPLEQAAMRAADALREAHEGRMVLEQARRRLRLGR